MSKFSIIIITLNEEKNLPNLLNDLKNQSFQNFEVIISDANSIDKTIDISNTYRSDFKSLKTVITEQKGLSLGRNKGEEIAISENLIFLDADSRIRTDFLSKLDSILKQNQVDVGGVYMDVSTGTKTERFVSFIFNAGLWITKWVFPTIIGACIISTKTAHNKIGGFNVELDINEDVEYSKKAYQHPEVKFQMLPLSFIFNMRRLAQNGYFKTIYGYTKYNIYRFLFGEIKKGTVKYDLGNDNDK